MDVRAWILESADTVELDGEGVEDLSESETAMTSFGGRGWSLSRNLCAMI